MRLRIEPIYGWGWSGPDKSRMDVPDPFELEVESLDGDAPLKIWRGQLPGQGHPLSGMWILLTQRHVEPDGYFNLAAFSAKPDSLTALHEIWGYAQAEISK